MDTPTKLVEVKQEYSDEEIKHEEICFELIKEEHYLSDDIEEESVGTDDENEEFNETIQSKGIKSIDNGEDMSNDW